MKDTLLIPAMLDMHFPLMRYAFVSKRYEPVVLEAKQEHVNLGLYYTHNDMCFPLAVMVGQMLAALRSGAYDPEHTALLMPTVGDACRGSNYTELLRKAIRKGGFPQTRVLTMNLKHIDDENQLPITPKMVWRALFALFYGDILLLLTQQVRPYERIKGDTERHLRHWYRVLGAELAHFRRLTIPAMLHRFARITADFAAIPRRDEKRQRIPIVGELYTKYCAMGNWDMAHFLEQSGCESFTNGLSWYVIYYIDAQLTKLHSPAAAGYAAVGAALEFLQRRMIKALTDAGFYSLPALHPLKQEAAGSVNLRASVGDGWLIGIETAGYIRHGCKKVLAVQPFGCMPNHIFGRGIYSSLARRLGGQVTAVELDANASRLNAYNRAKMLIDSEVRNEK